MVTNGNNGNSKKREQTAQRIIEAIGKAAGLLTVAAKNSGISYTTVNRYVHDFPSVAQAVHEAKERMLDFCEGKLYEKIKSGDNTAIIFYLKTQGKGRGYIERQEITGREGNDLIPHALNLIFPEGTEVKPGRMDGRLEVISGNST